MQVIAEEAAAAGTSDKAPPANPLLLGRSIEEYVLETVRRVRPGDLEQALLVLPFSDALRLLQYLCSWLAAGTQVRMQPTGWNLSRHRVEPKRKPVLVIHGRVCLLGV